MLTPRYFEALEYAAWLHRKQVRNGTEIPYITHPFAVSTIAIQYGANEDEAIAALLHDALEDQPQDGFTQREIFGLFGPEVLAIVEGCSDSIGTPKLPWRQRKEQYIEGLSGKSTSILLVSACDKLHNAQCILRDYQAIGNNVWSRFAFTGKKEGTLWYYRALADQFYSVMLHPLLEDTPRPVASRLADVVTEIEIAVEQAS
jgi:(p)ppGpp synthase/HD superfamily hydrolase